MSTTTNEPVDAVLDFLALWAPVAAVICAGIAFLLIVSAILVPILRAWWHHVSER